MADTARDKVEQMADALFDSKTVNYFEAPVSRTDLIELANYGFDLGAQAEYENLTGQFRDKIIRQEASADAAIAESTAAVVEAEKEVIKLRKLLSTRIESTRLDRAVEEVRSLRDALQKLKRLSQTYATSANYSDAIDTDYFDAMREQRALTANEIDLILAAIDFKENE